MTSELADKKSKFYFAELDQHVITNLKLNFSQAQTELKEEKATEIERIYVLKNFQGKSVSQLLLDKAIQRAVQSGSDYVGLGVWEKIRK